jgi:hypothetical protein
MQAFRCVSNKIAVVLHQKVAVLLIAGFMEMFPDVADINLPRAGGFGLLVGLHKIPP